MIPSFNYFNIVSFSSLNKLIIATLMSFSDESSIPVPQRQFLLSAFFLGMGHILLFLTTLRFLQEKNTFFFFLVFYILAILDTCHSPTSLNCHQRLVCSSNCLVTWINYVSDALSPTVCSLWCHSLEFDTLGIRTVLLILLSRWRWCYQSCLSLAYLPAGLLAGLPHWYHP